MSVLRRHWLLFAVLLIDAVFVFANLDNAYLSIGEGNTALLGKNVLKFGYPRAWDGEYMAVPMYDGTINGDLAWVTHPWLQYYVAAAGTALFGPTNAGARVMFGLMGLAAVVALYRLVLEMRASPALAKLAMAIFGLHPLFWLYSRQCRYYAPTMLWMSLLLIAYLRWRKTGSWWALAAFIVVSVLLFHTLYTVWGVMMLGIGIYYLVFDCNRETLPRFSGAAAAISALTLPWFIYAPPRFHFNLSPTLIGYGNRLAVHLWKIHVLFYPFLTLAIILAATALVHKLLTRNQPGRESAIGWQDEYWLLAAVAVYVPLVVLYPFFTTHYMLPVLPFGAIAAAWLLLKIREHSRWLCAASLGVLLATNVFHILPYIAVDKLFSDPDSLEAPFPNPTATMTPGTPLRHYLTEQLAYRFYVFDFWEFLHNDHSHQLKGVTAFLREHAGQGESILVPWQDANALAFYTGLHVLYHTQSPFFRNQQLKEYFPPIVDADWIVPLEIDMPRHFYLTEEFESRYEKVVLDYPKEYFETYPNLEFFNFRTNASAPGKFFILKLTKARVMEGRSEHETIR
jgi:4-amino-4-deoxy-L-arabinose transferase-like glycosyltransferase